METKNNMGKKYIIELEDEPFGKNDDPRIPHGLEELWRVKGFKSLVFDKNGLNKLQPADEALESAYAHGETSAEAKYHEMIEKEKKEIYHAGAFNMLEAIRGIHEAKCVHEWEEMGFTCKEDDYSSNLRSIIFGHTPEKIIELVLTHKKEKEGMRRNINAIISNCGYSLEEIYKTAKEMLDES